MAYLIHSVIMHGLWNCSNSEKFGHAYSLFIITLFHILLLK